MCSRTWSSRPINRPRTGGRVHRPLAADLPLGVWCLDASRLGCSRRMRGRRAGLCMARPSCAWTRHRDAELPGGRQQPIVVADEQRQIRAKALRRCQMDRVETPQPVDRKQPGRVEQRVIDSHELEAVDQLARASDRCWPLGPHRPKHLDPGERARAPTYPPSQEGPKRVGFSLVNDNLHDRRRIEVSASAQRSSARMAASSSLGRGAPGRGSSGAPSSSGSPAAGDSCPDARRSSARLERGIGTSRATGRPCSVTSMASPR